MYDAAKNFLIAINRDPRFDNPELATFDAKVFEAAFLFEADVVNYLAQIKDRAIGVRANERKGDFQSSVESLTWLTGQLTEMKKVFMPYLGFAQIKRKLV